jgi:hypothetical protein
VRECVCVCVCERSKKREAIPLRGRGGLYGCGMFRISRYLDIGLTDGREVTLRADRALPFRKFIFLFLVLISVRG